MSRLKDIPLEIFRMITESLSFKEKIKLTFIRDEYNIFMKNKILKNQNNISIIDNIFRVEDFETLTYYLEFVEKNEELYDELIFERFNNRQLLNYSIQFKLNKIAKILISIAISLNGYKFLNLTNQFGETPFLTAVKFKNIEIVNEFLIIQKKNNILNLVKNNIYGESVLSYSLKNKYFKVLKELINLGKIKNLFLICCKKGYMKILNKEDLNIVELIKKLNVREKRELINDGIFEAIENNHLNVIRYIVKKFNKNYMSFINIPKKSIHEYNLIKVSTLLLAAINNRENIVDYLVNKNIKIDKTILKQMRDWEIKQSIIEKVINKFDNIESYEDSEEYKYFHDDFTLF